MFPLNTWIKCSVQQEMGILNRKLCPQVPGDLASLSVPLTVQQEMGHVSTGSCVRRYLAISRPFRYHSLMSPRRSKILVSLVWIVSFIICFPPLIGWNERGTYSTSGSRGMKPEVSSKNVLSGTSAGEVRTDTSDTSTPCIAPKEV